MATSAGCQVTRKDVRCACPREMTPLSRSVLEILLNSILSAGHNLSKSSRRIDDGRSDAGEPETCFKFQALSYGDDAASAEGPGIGRVHAIGRCGGVSRKTLLALHGFGLKSIPLPEAGLRERRLEPLKP